MWDPNIDVIEFLGKGIYTPNNMPTPLRLFEKQYPSQLTEVRRLVVSSTMWPQGQHTNAHLIWPLVRFLRLEELVIAVDAYGESRIVNGWPGRWSNAIAMSSNDALLGLLDVNNFRHPTWKIPEDVQSHLNAARERYEEHGPKYVQRMKHPVVRVVFDKKEILSKLSS